MMLGYLRRHPAHRRRLITSLILFVAAFFRLFNLATLPPSPYWEEVALGYDAYSIAITGRDHHGHWLPLVAFESFGDWKPSGYMYSLVPFIKVFSLSVWTVRLPAALSGVFIVWGIGELTRVLVQLSGGKRAEDRTVELIPFIAMAVASVSPWLIIFSRAAWEVNLATCLALWGVVVGIKVITDQIRDWWWLTVSAVLLVLSMYTYHALRLVAPVLGLGLVGWWWSNHHFKLRFWQQQGKTLVVTGLIAALLVLPFIASFGSVQTSQRFAETSIFSQLDIIEESNNRIAASGNSFLGRLMYHRYVLFSREIVSNFLSHFNPGFLFVTGDQNARHSVQYLGQLYHIEALFVLMGAWVLFKKWHKGHAFMCLWLVVGIIPASITLAAPHALRTLPIVPVLIYVIALGLAETVRLLSSLGVRVSKAWGRFAIRPDVLKNLVIMGVVAVYVVEVLVFWRFYSLIYPRLYADDWQYGYEEVVAAITDFHQQYPDVPVVMTREFGRPAMYYWFYTQTDPQLVQAAEPPVSKDQGEYLAFDFLTFVRGGAEVPLQPSLVVGSVATAEQIQLHYPAEQIEVITTINDMNHQPQWRIVRLK